MPPPVDLFRICNIVFLNYRDTTGSIDYILSTIQDLHLKRVIARVLQNIQQDSDILEDGIFSSKPNPTENGFLTVQYGFVIETGETCPLQIFKGVFFHILKLCGLGPTKIKICKNSGFEIYISKANHIIPPVTSALPSTGFPQLSDLLLPHQARAVERMLEVFAHCTDDRRFLWLFGSKSPNLTHIKMGVLPNGHLFFMHVKAHFIRGLFNWVVLTDPIGVGKTRTSLSFVKADGGATIVAANNLLVLTKPVLIPQWEEECALLELHNTCSVTVTSHEKFQKRFVKLDGLTTLGKMLQTPGRFSHIIVDEAHCWLEHPTQKIPQAYTQFIKRNAQAGYFPKTLFVTGTPPNFSAPSTSSWVLECLCPSEDLPSPHAVSHLAYNECKRRCIHQTTYEDVQLPTLVENRVLIEVSEGESAAMRAALETSKQNADSKMYQMGCILDRAFRIDVESGVPAHPWWGYRNSLQQLKRKTYGVEDRDCVVCCNEKIDVSVLECGHSFCDECVETWMKTNPECPVCKAPIVLSQIFNLKNVSNPPVPLAACVQKVAWLQSMCANNTTDQFLVFCEKASICNHLKSLMGDTVLNEVLVGTLPQFQKNKVCSDFKKRGFQVLFTTLRSASVGINFQMVRHVVFWTRFFSDKTLQQACGRLKRMGSTNEFIQCHFLCFNLNNATGLGGA